MNVRFERNEDCESGYVRSRPYIPICEPEGWDHVEKVGLVAVAENRHGQSDGQNPFEIDSLRPLATATATAMITATATASGSQNR